MKIKINYFHTKRILVQGLYNEKKTKISLEGSNHSRKKERKKGILHYGEGFKIPFW